jgi:hypothetical protein
MDIFGRECRLRCEALSQISISTFFELFWIIDRHYDVYYQENFTNSCQHVPKNDIDWNFDYLCDSLSVFSAVKSVVEWKWRLNFLLAFVLITPRCGQKSLQKFGNLWTKTTHPKKDRMTDGIGSMSVFCDFLFLRSSRYKIKSFYAHADNVNIGASHLKYCQIFI